MPPRKPLLEPREAMRDPQGAAGFSQRPEMAALRMFVEMMKDNGALNMIARASGESLDLGVQLLDQSLPVRRDDVHGRSASASPVEKRLPATHPPRKKGGPNGTALNSVQETKS